MGEDDRAWLAAQHRVSYLGRRVAGAGVAEYVEIDHLQTKIVHSADSHVVVVRRARAKKCRYVAGELGDQTLVDHHLVNHLGNAAGAGNAVDRSTRHRQRSMRGAVVGDFKQWVGCQLLEPAWIGIDPAREI